MADSRRSFLRAMLAACASSLSYSSALGQIIPSDNAFQAQLSHLYTREGNQLRQIILLNIQARQVARWRSRLAGKPSHLI
jgi:hypothetical protein